MNVSIPSILFGLGGKCLLNWTLVFLQRNHISRSFLGVFSASLAVVDTTLTLFITTLHTQDDGRVLLQGLQLTRYHVCLLVQILGQVYSALQWPVVISAGLVHFCAVTQRLQPTAARARWFVYVLVTTLLWCLAVLYTFLLSDFVPVLEDVPHSQIHQCWVSSTSQILQVVVLLLLTLGGATFYAVCSTLLLKNPPLQARSRTIPSLSLVHQAVLIFLNTWALFLVFVAVLHLLPVGIPAYLGLNAAWLCFLNSLLIAVILCVVCPASQLAQDVAAVPPDSFCEWRFKYSLAAGDRT